MNSLETWSQQYIWDLTCIENLWRMLTWITWEVPGLTHFLNFPLNYAISGCPRNTWWINEVMNFSRGIDLIFTRNTFYHICTMRKFHFPDFTVRHPTPCTCHSWKWVFGHAGHSLDSWFCLSPFVLGHHSPSLESFAFSCYSHEFFL